MIDACTEGKIEDFQDTFEEMLEMFNRKEMTTAQVVDFLGCSMGLLAMQSDDPRGYMGAVTECMNQYVDRLSNGAGIPHSE